MTEEEWLTATDPVPMLEFLRGTVSDRKLRLFAVACCRRVWHLLEDEACRRAVEVAEQFADSLVTSTQLSYTRKKALRGGAERASHGPADSAGVSTTFKSAFGAAYNGHLHAITARFRAEVSGAPLGLPTWNDAYDRVNFEERVRLSGLLREVVGNPFRPVAFDPAWRSETAVALAFGIYAERAFDRLPILADALEEAGCDHADILAHCRGPGPHARGCWVVDLVLNKS